MRAGTPVTAPSAGPRAREPVGYPTSWEVDSLLIDGSGVRLRPILPSDEVLVADFHRSLSKESVYLRYFGAVSDLSKRDLERATNPNYETSMAIVALVAERLIGVASYERLDGSNAAEVAFAVADEYQGRGVGTLLLESLAAYAREQGIEQFVADTLPENSVMIAVFEDAGMSEISRFVDGVVRVRLDLKPTPEYFVRREQRERVAAAASVASFLRPRTIAVIGAGRKPGGVGHAIVQALLAGDFAGIVYPVNPAATSICGVRAYASISEVPSPVDVAVVAVPPVAVRDVVEEAADAKVQALVIITSGFAETGQDGADIECELLEIARRAGTRIVGPNCLGVSSTDPEIRANATFSPVAPLPGRVGLFTQSGAVGIVLLEEAQRVGIGVSNFVSVGNKLDVSGNDLLCFWEDDPRTDVIAMYLESFGNPRKFLRIAQRVGRSKPIVALKAGRTVAGARGARSHTAAAATPAVASDALLSAAGIVAVESLDEMLDVVAVFAGCPLPGGRRVALVGNSGGPLILAADACSAAGLLVPELSLVTQDALRSALTPAAAVTNPVDATADGGSQALEIAVRTVLADDGIDAAIVVITPLLSMAREAAVEAIDLVAKDSSKPIVACVFGELTSSAIERNLSFVVVPSPERAAVALERSATYSEWRARGVSEPARPTDVNLGAARALVHRFLETNPEGGWLDVDEANALLSAFGVPLIESIAASSSDDSVIAASKLGYPVALKAAGGELVHKTEAGGVALALTDDASVADAYASMERTLGANFGRVVVQKMADGGVEVIVGLTVDVWFGPLIMFGIGGVATDVLGDHAFGVPPISGDDAARLVESIRGAPLFHGYRGSGPVDVAAVRDVLERVSSLSDEIPEVAELDLNPLIVSGDGAVVVDWKVRVLPRPSGPDAYMRILRRRAVVRPLIRRSTSTVNRARAHARGEQGNRSAP